MTKCKFCVIHPWFIFDSFYGNKMTYVMFFSAVFGILPFLTIHRARPASIIPLLEIQLDSLVGLRVISTFFCFRYCIFLHLNAKILWLSAIKIVRRNKWDTDSVEKMLLKLKITVSKQTKKTLPTKILHSTVLRRLWNTAETKKKDEAVDPHSLTWKKIFNIVFGA